MRLDRWMKQAPLEKRARRMRMALWNEESIDLYERFFRFLRITRTDRQELALPAPLADSFVEDRVFDLTRDCFSLLQVLHDLVWSPRGPVPANFRRFGFH